MYQMKPASGIAQVFVDLVQFPAGILSAQFCMFQRGRVQFIGDDVKNFTPGAEFVDFKQKLLDRIQGTVV